MATFIALIIFIIACIVTYFKPTWAIYLTLFLLPSYLIRFSLFGFPTTLLELLILANVLIFIFRQRFSFNILKNWYGSGYFWPTITLIIFATISVFVGPNLIKAIGLWRAYFIEPVLFFIVITQTLKSKKELVGVFWALSLSGLYCALISFWQVIAGILLSDFARLPATISNTKNWLGYFGYPAGLGFYAGDLTWWYIPKAFLKANFTVDRAVSVFGYPNGLGLYLGPIVILTSGFLAYFKDPAWKQALKLVIIAAGFAALVLAQSIGALIAVLICWFVWLIVNKKTRWWAVAAIVFGGLIFWLVTFTPYYAKVLTDKLYSGFIRSLIWSESWRMLKDNWLWGAGIWGYQTKIVPYHLKTFEIFLFPHNIILNFWSEIGLLGLLSFIWLCAKFIWKNAVLIWQKAENGVYLMLILSVVQMVLHGLIDVPYFRNDLAVMFWAIIAASVVYQKSVTEK